MENKKYIYLDWNIIQYMKHSSKIEKKDINGKEFENLINKLSKKYIFPWSEGHLQDLLISLNPNNLEYIKEDLIFLKKISNNFALGIDEYENLRTQKNYIDIQVFFDELRNKNEIEEKQELVVNVEGSDTFQIDMNKLKNNSLLKPFLQKTNGVLNNQVMHDFTFQLYENMDNPNFYKLLRNEVQNLKNQFEATPNSVLSQESNYFNELKPFLDFLITDNIETIKDNFNKIMISYLNVDKKRRFEELTIGSKIELAYSILDFNQNFRDKINKKNRPSNMYRDIKNLFFASQAKYYITEDDKTYKKSKFVCDVLGLKVKVLKMNEFINKFR